MANAHDLQTVNWVGDGDELYFFESVERVFDLKLRREIPWTTFGDAFDHVDAYVQRHGTGPGCATQMAFYRLRSALLLGRNTGPDAPVAPLVGGNLKARFRDLEADTGLAMPPPAFGPLGWVAVGLFSATLPVAIILGFGGRGAGVAALLVMTGWICRVRDHGRWPRGIATLGNLARAVADLNRGRLAKAGARLTSAEIWAIIQALGASETGIDPAVIGPDTTFFKSTVKIVA